MSKGYLLNAVVFACAFALSGCAAPIKYLMESERETLASGSSDGLGAGQVVSEDSELKPEKKRLRALLGVADLRQALAEHPTMTSDASRRKPVERLDRPQLNGPAGDDGAKRSLATSQQQMPAQSNIPDRSAASSGNAPELFRQAVMKYASQSGSSEKQPVAFAKGASATVNQSSLTKTTKTAKPATGPLPDEGTVVAMAEQVPSTPAARHFPIDDASMAIATQTISFPESSANLGDRGNGLLADLLQLADAGVGHRVVVSGGLSGTGEAFARFRLATKRAGTVAQHVPPPLEVEKRLDPELDVSVVRVEIKAIRQ